MTRRRRDHGHDPLLAGREPGVDPNAPFLAHGSQAEPGNDAGPLLALQRLVRWLVVRRPRG